MKRLIAVLASLLLSLSVFNGCGPAPTKGSVRLSGLQRPAVSIAGPKMTISIGDRQYNVITRAVPKPYLAGCDRRLYVDAIAGSNEGDGSMLHAFKDIQPAIDAAGPGTAIIIRGGVYDGPLRISRSGLPGKPIVLTAAQGQQVVVAMSRIGADNLLPCNIVLEDASHIEIRGLIIDGLIDPELNLSACSGIAVYGGGDGCRLADNVICRQSTSGISIFSSRAGGGMLCEGNVICDVGGDESSAGLLVLREDCTIEDNVVFNVQGNGIEIARSAMRAKVTRNVCFHCTAAGIKLGNGPDGYAASVPPRVISRNVCWANAYGLTLFNRSHGSVIRNNIFAGNTQAEVATGGCPMPFGNELRRNCIFPARLAFGANAASPDPAPPYEKVYPDGPPLADPEMLSLDPAFMDPDGGDFRLSFKSALAEEVGPVFGFASPLTKASPANPPAVARACVNPLKEFQSCRIAPPGQWDYMFPPGDFPKIQWQEPDRVRKLVGNVPLKVRWFDNELNEVVKAEKPGRYAAVVEGKTESGFVVRRAMTFYCRPADWRPWENLPKVRMEYMQGSPIDRQAWEQRQDDVSGWVGDMFVDSLESRPEGAMFMSYLASMKPMEGKPTRVDSWDVYDQDFHLALKRKLMGVENKYPALKPPRRVSGQASPVLRDGTPAEAGVKDDAAERIRSACREWWEQGKEPFVVLVARHGVIVIHEPFGSNAAGPVTRQTQFGLASLSKLVTGTMFGQFVDQGLIGLDDPVGKYFDCFPNREGKFTLRQCFTHTTGLTGHEEFGGMANPHLENVLASGVPVLHPGRYHDYNGMGLDLGGKVMEVVGGKSIFRLMQENFFGPLGADGIVMHDLACDSKARAEDLGRIGQLLLNKGRYGELEFFSAGTFDQMRPQPLRNVLPQFGDDCVLGVGMQRLIQAHPNAGVGDVPKDKLVLGAGMFGHGASSETVLRIDPDNDLVIVVARNRGGKKMQENRTKFLMTIEECLVK